MKVYFTASIAGQKHYTENYRKIVATLQQMGCQVTAEHILGGSESKIRLETKDERVAFHKKLVKWIKDADCMVVEASFPSISVGYEISLAVHQHKPVLILYCEGDPPSLLYGWHEETMVCERYQAGDLRTILEGFIDYIQGKTESRFTFFVTPQIMAHLDRVVSERKEPKSVYIRRLIEKDMGEW